MNTLGRDIEAGEVVILKLSEYKPEYQEEYRPRVKRAFVCNGQGFGTSPRTAGTAVFGHWLTTSEPDRIEGYEIDPEETKAFQQASGRFPDAALQEKKHAAPKEEELCQLKVL